MEVEALLSILMDDMVMVDGSEGIQGATAACYQITGARTTAHTHTLQNLTSTGREHKNWRCRRLARQAKLGRRDENQGTGSPRCVSAASCTCAVVRALTVGSCWPTSCTNPQCTDRRTLSTASAPKPSLTSHLSFPFHCDSVPTGRRRGGGPGGRVAGRAPGPGVLSHPGLPRPNTAPQVPLHQRQGWTIL
jgi:hypothetical protein